MSDTEHFYEIWKTLSQAQRRFVMAMTRYSSKREAALALGLRPDTVYHWPPAVDEALSLLLADVLNAAWDNLREAAARAAHLKTEALELEDMRLSQQAATEILDRVLGKPRPQTRTIQPDDDFEVRVIWEEPE